MKLLILDKDFTVIRPASGKTFVQHPEDQVLLPGVAEAIARYAADGWTMAIASNQGGVAAGCKTLEAMKQEMLYCLKLLPEYSIFRAYACPDNGQTCWEFAFPDMSRICPVKTWQGRFRKPDPGMLRQALDLVMVYGIVSEVLYVGDRPEDEQAAKAAGVGFMWAHEWRGDRPTP